MKRQIITLDLSDRADLRPHIQEKLSLGSMIESADSYFSRLSDSGLYGKREEKHQFLARRIYVPATPCSMAEEYKRYGEVFSKF